MLDNPGCHCRHGKCLDHIASGKRQALVQSLLTTVMEFASILATTRRPQSEVARNRFPAVDTIKPPASRHRSESAHQAFSAVEMRHHFAIWKLTTATSGNETLQLYFCTRCKWAFSVEARRGLVTPLDGNGNQLGAAIARDRLATFACGPCPVFTYLTQDSRQTQSVTLMDNLRTRLVARLFAGYHSILASLRWRGDRSTA
jgi:hypothetical protein